MNIREKIQERENQLMKERKSFDRALLRAGLIIIAGYLFGTLIAWIILR